MKMLRLKPNLIRLGISSMMLLLSYAIQAANTVLLDPATLETGTEVGENLQVLGGCPVSNENCLPEEEIKYISVPKGVYEPGRLELDINFTDNFELDVNVHFTQLGGDRTITLYKIENDDRGSLFVKFYFALSNAKRYVIFNHDNRINTTSEEIGWKYIDPNINNIGLFNNLKISAKNGIASLSFNGVAFKTYANETDTVKLSTSRPFIKLVIDNVGSFDRLYDITLKDDTEESTTTPTTNNNDFETGKQAGIQQCVSDPNSCGISITETGSNDGAHATYNPATGEVHIPFINVPGPFGGTQIYEVYLIQQPSSFTFDLDTNRVVPK